MISIKDGKAVLQIDQTTVNLPTTKGSKIVNFTHEGSPCQAYVETIPFRGRLHMTVHLYPVNVFRKRQFTEILNP